MSRALILAAVLSAGALPSRAFSPGIDAKILEGMEAAYRFDFKGAAAVFEELGRAEPEHPAGPFFLASLQWLDFSQNADIPEILETLEPKFERIMDETLERAKKMEDKNSDDPEAHFYLGAAYGMKGRWLLLKRQWIRAAYLGYKGYKHLKKTVKLDPGFYDAYLGLGMYDYYSDTLPGIMGFAADLIVRGDKKRGIGYVQLAIRKGRYSSVEGRLFLAGIYTGYENEPLKALELIEELREEWPDNLFFAFMELGARMDALDWEGAVVLGEEIVPKAGEVSYAKDHISLFELYFGDAYLGAKNYSKALETFDRCVKEAPEPRRAAVTYCRLRRAQAYDLLGLREEALKDYSFVKDRPDFFDSRKKAKKGLKTPATYDLVVEQLLE